MKIFKSLLCIFLAFMVLAGCDANILGEDAGREFFEQAEKLNFEAVDQGVYANLEEQNLAIKSEQQFKDFWASLHSNKKPLPDTPSIDFNNQMVLVSVMATKPSGGYGVAITKVGLLNDQIGVRVQNVKPGKNCITTAALTNPYHIVAISKSDKPIKFFEEKLTVDCSE
jgi:hypothetical protein